MTPSARARERSERVRRLEGARRQARGEATPKATGELVERSTYQAYGGTESDYRPERWKSFREDYRFTGKEEDVEVGLIYFGKRFLNPLLNRWISADPLTIHGLGADPNLYAYVSGQVLRGVDPLGLKCNENESCSDDQVSSLSEYESAQATEDYEDNERRALAATPTGDTLAPGGVAPPEEAEKGRVLREYSARESRAASRESGFDEGAAMTYGAGAIAASMMPVLGELMDIHDLSESRTDAQRALIMGSLSLGMILTVLPNASGFRRAGDALHEATKLPTAVGWRAADKASKADGRLTAAIIEHRQAAGLLTPEGMKRNVAAVLVKVDGEERILTAANRSGAEHSEELLAAEIHELRSQGKSVHAMELLTERIPCSNSGGCRQMIQGYMKGVRVYHFAKGGAGSAKKLQTEYGLRLVDE